MQRLAFAAFATASMLAAGPVLAQSAPTGAPVVTPAAPAAPAATAKPASSDGGCAWKKQYTS